MPIEENIRLRNSVEPEIDAIPAPQIPDWLVEAVRDPSFDETDEELERMLEDEEEYHSSEPEFNDDDLVKLYENSEKIKYKDAIHVQHFGFFKKDDPRVFKDKFYNNLNLIIDEKLSLLAYAQIYAIYEEIDAKGNLINPSYTVAVEYSSNYIQVNNPNHKLSEFSWLDDKFVDNNVFKYYYVESVNTGNFYHKDDLISKDILIKQNDILYRKHKSVKSFKNLVANKPMTYIKMLGKKYTWGVEIETSSGYLPKHLDKKLVYDAVHDGSLRDENGNVFGGEYVTSVLYGDLGLQQLKMLCNELSKRCMINKRCGVHVHIGGATFNKESVVLMYYLYKKMENSIFNILPESRRDNEYCRKLPNVNINISSINQNREYNIDYYYNTIMTILSSGYSPDHKVNKKHDHPKGFKCGYDHSAARYCWVNFIPAVFNTRKNEVYTIEFRPHSASTSYYKIKNWLFICIALIDIVENHKKEIYNNPNITLQDIIRIVYPKNHMQINDYIEKRTLKFADKSINHEISDYTDNEVTDDLTLKSL
jgi:hypothetical protein